MTDLNDLVSLAVSLLTIGGALWALMRFANRPRLFCGVPPSLDEASAKGFEARQVGQRAVAGAFRHRRRTLALRLRGGSRKQTLSARDRRRCSDPLRSRVLKRSEQGIVGVPVLVVNAGGRAAVGYTANIELHEDEPRPGLHIVDVFTEGLEFGLYTSEPDRLRDSTRQRAQTTTPMPVVEDYVSYMGEGVGRYGDWVFLWGALDAHSYELIHVDLFVAPEIEHFYLVFFLDSADSWLRSKHYIQRVEIEPSRASPGRLAPCLR